MRFITVKILLCFFLLIHVCHVFASAGVRCVAHEDSAKVVQLLHEAKAQVKDGKFPSYFAHKLLGVPYVAGTLDVSDGESLVVNLREMDCTTFVENVMALSNAVRQADVAFEHFTTQLTKIRYCDGAIDGYASRNHYFSEWIESGVRHGMLSDVLEEKGCSLPLKCRKLNLNFMSTHTDTYPQLKGDTMETARIVQKEQRMNGKEIRYIPKDAFASMRSFRGVICDGDILALVTKISGLDVSHVGIAQWKNGQLHLLHASSKYGRVLLDPQTLYHYLRKSPLLLGVRVLRIL